MTWVWTAVRQEVSNFRKLSSRLVQIALDYQTILSDYSLIQTKCQGGNKYALPITVKSEQSTRKFGRISLHACSS